MTNLNKIWLLLLLIALLAGLVLSLRMVPKFLPLKETERMLAMQGVASNADWEPVVRRINGLDMVLVLVNRWDHSPMGAPGRVNQ